MRKTILIVNFLVLCTLSLAANFVFSPVDTHAQSSQGAEQQADREIGPLAAPTGEPRAGRGTYFAVVGHQGFLFRGSGVVGVTRFRAAYVVTFDADVSKCAYTASISSHPLGGALGGIQVAESNDGLDPRRVIVYTFDSSFQSSDRDFHLIVNC